MWKKSIRIKPIATSSRASFHIPRAKYHGMKRQKKWLPPRCCSNSPAKWKVLDANQILVEHVHAITFKLQGTTYEPNFQQIEGKCNSKAIPIVKAHNLCDVLESSADEKLRLVAHPNCVPTILFICYPRLLLWSIPFSGFFFFLGQFCDVAKVGMIDRKILPNLATS
jgi:hypothetical protein